MDLSTFHRLLSPEGRAALAAAADSAPTEATLLTCLERLRKHFDSDLARAAVDTVLLRTRAATKFTRAAEMFFTREALEQASGEAVSAYRAKRFAGFDPLADLGCGIGGDAISLGLEGRKVVAFDTNPVRAAMAEANLCVYRIAAEVNTTDVLTADLSKIAAAFCDPARRAEGRRFLSIADYVPTPLEVRARFPTGFPLAFKLAPGVPVEDAVGLRGEVEFLSVNGELKECVAWLGSLRTTARRATVLPRNESLCANSLPEEPDVTPIGAYFFDLDPTIVRSGLLGVLAEKIAATRFDHVVAGLTSDNVVSSPFVTAFHVEEVIPFHAKKVGAWLKQRGIGRITPVKRGSDVDTDLLLKTWKLSGSEHRTVIFTRVEGKSVAVVANRIG